jgi:hypothetical protein
VTRRRWLAALAAALTLAGCRSSELTIRYHLEGLSLESIASIATFITPIAPRRFAVEVPETVVGEGVSYRVSCADCPEGLCDAACGPRLRIDADRGRGFVVAPELTMRFRENGAAPAGRIVVSADAFSEGARSLLRRPPTVEVEFLGGATVDLYLREGVPCGATSCGRDQLCCGESDPKCVDPRADAQDCGGCGRVCGQGAACVAGSCRCGDGPACSGTDICCGAGGCVDTQTDPKHCGACGRACNPGEACVGGACVCPSDGHGMACAAGQKCCGGVAGGCRPLEEGCPCGATTCTVAQMCCAGPSEQCASLDEDEASCGQCGRSCAAALECKGGLCTCNGGTTECKNTCCASGCRDLQTDNNDCGACGVACKSLEGEACVAGKCLCGAVDCGAADKLCCAGGCVRSMTHCTGCGQGCSTNSADACGKDASGEWGCRCGAGPACGGGQRCCAGACVDVLTSKQHCGACGAVCPMSGNPSVYTCANGMCRRDGCDPACPANETCDAPSNSCTCRGPGGMPIVAS